MDKPREYWLSLQDLEFGKYRCKSVEVTNFDPSSEAEKDPEQWGDFKNALHVIEYVAIEKLQEEKVDLAKALLGSKRGCNNCSCEYCSERKI